MYEERLGRSQKGSEEVVRQSPGRSCLRQQMRGSAKRVERLGHMVSIKEELELAKAAKAALKALLTATSKPAVLTTLKNAYRAAVLNLFGGALNAARAKVG